MNYKSLRFKILLLLTFTSIFLVVIIQYINYKARDTELYNASVEKLLLATKIIKNLDKKERRTYKKRIQFLNKNTQILHALTVNDIPEAKKHLQHLFQIYKLDTPNLEHLHFYNTQGIYKLGLHHKKIYDKVEIKENEILALAQQHKKFTYGYILKENIFYKAYTAPLYYHNTLIGYIEFGVKMDGKIRFMSKSAKYKYAIFVKAHTNTTTPLKAIVASSEIFSQIKIDQNFIHTYANTNKLFKYNKHYYLFHTYDLATPYQKDFAQVLFLNDVTTYVQQSHNYMVKILEISILLLSFVIFIVYIAMKKLTNKLIEQEQSLREEHQQLQLIMDNTNNLILILKNGKIAQTNQPLLSYFSCKNISCIMKKYKKISQLFECVDVKSVCKDINNRQWIQSILKLPEDKRVVVAKNKENVQHYFQIKIVQTYTADDSDIIIFNDITKIYKAALKNEYIANHDPLTKIFNRQYFNNIAEELIEEIKTSKQNTSLLLLDIDYFKRVNDTYGHNVGDIVLQEFAQVVSSLVRKDDIFVRWGGEEFIIVLKGTDTQQAQKIAEKIREKVAQHTFSHVKHITCSIGVAQFDPQSDTLNSWFERVDEALYKAKANGRNRVEVL